MAVAKSVTLPAQGPHANDRTILVGLGGNGFTGPQSLYEVDVNLDGDVSGGNSVITIVFDTRFESILLLADTVNIGTALDTAVVYQLGSTVPFTGVGTGLGMGIISECHSSWSPPPMVHRDQITVTTVNRDGDDHSLRCLIYNYNIRATEFVPLSRLLSTLPRSASFIGLQS